MSAPANGISWLTRRLVELGRGQIAQGRARYNPRPAGVIRPASTTEAVLAYLQAQADTVWLCKWQILRGTGCTIKSVDHALRFLVASGLVKSAPDGSRNSRYLRYQAALRSPKREAMTV